MGVTLKSCGASLSCSRIPKRVHKCPPLLRSHSSARTLASSFPRLSSSPGRASVAAGHQFVDKSLFLNSTNGSISPAWKALRDD